jgi:hypothetical protein
VVHHQVAVVGDTVYITDFSRPYGRAFSKKPHTELFKFVARARETLRRGCPNAIVDGGLGRVDVMRRASGQLVVNEFESLEACYEGVYDADSVATRTRMKAYWLGKMTSILKVTPDPC